MRTQVDWRQAKKKFSFHFEKNRRNAVCHVMFVHREHLRDAICDDDLSNSTRPIIKFTLMALDALDTHNAHFFVIYCCANAVVFIYTAY